MRRCSHSSMKCVALSADSLKMMPSLAMTPTRWPQMRANPVTIDEPHSGLNSANRDPSTRRAMISRAENGMRSSALTIPYRSSAGNSGGSGACQSSQPARSVIARWFVVWQISRSLA